MTIVYKTEKRLPEPSVRALYEEAGWTAYTKDIPGLMRAMANSLAVVSAWEEGELAGLIRVVGDGESILYIQDILVRKSHKRRGIGTRLLKTVLEDYSDVRQKVLLTEDSPETRGFYEANGFMACDQKILAFARFD